MKGERGIVLLNALVLVAAIAAAALLVMREAHTSRASFANAQQTDQLMAYLDAFEAHAITVLMLDNAQIDHAGEAWARPSAPFDLDRGQVRGTIVDLQSHFNLNWLANPTDVHAADSFDSLLNRVGARQGVSDVLEKAFRIDLAETSGYDLMDPPGHPTAGPRVMIGELARIPNLSPRDLARLAPHVTVLPGDSTVNVNTATADVLAGFFPAIKAEQLRAVLARRAQTPFASVEDFVVAIETAQSEGLGATFDQTRFSVGSDWFGVEVEATLAGRQAQRTVVLERMGPGRRPRVYWRITQLN